MGLLGIAESAQVAVITGLVTVIALVITQVANYRQSRAEREVRLSERKAELLAEEAQRAVENAEWYSRNLFERQLQAANDAFVWVMKINVLLNQVTSDRAGKGEDLWETARQAREWYDNNAIFLYDGYPGSSHFVGLTNTAAQFARSEQTSGVWTQFNDAYKEVINRADEIMRKTRASADD